MDNLWYLGDELRGQSKASEDHQWSVITTKLAELTRSKGEQVNHLEISKSSADAKQWGKFVFQEDSKHDNLNLNLMNLDFKANDVPAKNSFRNSVFGMHTMYQKSNININSFKLNLVTNKYGSGNGSRDVDNNTNHSNNNSNKNENSITSSNNNNNNSASDKRFKTLPSVEMLPRYEVLGGYIFVCNNDTMQEDLKRQLFGLPPRYRDSVRAITPGLPLFLYNYTTHQLHGIFEAASFGGTNIDPMAWEDKKCKGESRFPAQVRIRVRKICKALEEDAFRPVLFHYDGPKFRLELSIKETLDLLDLCSKASM